MLVRSGCSSPTRTEHRHTAACVFMFSQSPGIIIIIIKKHTLSIHDRPDHPHSLGGRRRGRRNKHLLVDDSSQLNPRWKRVTDPSALLEDFWRLHPWLNRQPRSGRGLLSIPRCIPETRVVTFCAKRLCYMEKRRSGVTGMTVRAPRHCCRPH